MTIESPMPYRPAFGWAAVSRLESKTMRENAFNGSMEEDADTTLAVLQHRPAIFGINVGGSYDGAMACSEEEEEEDEEDEDETILGSVDPDKRHTTGARAQTAVRPLMIRRPSPRPGQSDSRSRAAQDARRSIRPSAPAPYPSSFCASPEARHPHDVFASRTPDSDTAAAAADAAAAPSDPLVQASFAAALQCLGSALRLVSDRVEHLRDNVGSLHDGLRSLRAEVDVRLAASDFGFGLGLDLDLDRLGVGLLDAAQRRARADARLDAAQAQLDTLREALARLVEEHARWGRGGEDADADAQPVGGAAGRDGGRLPMDGSLAYTPDMGSF